MCNMHVHCTQFGNLTKTPNFTFRRNEICWNWDIICYQSLENPPAVNLDWEPSMWDLHERRKSENARCLCFVWTATNSIVFQDLYFLQSHGYANAFSFSFIPNAYMLKATWLRSLLFAKGVCTGVASNSTEKQTRAERRRKVDSRPYDEDALSPSTSFRKPQKFCSETWGVACNG